MAAAPELVPFAGRVVLKQLIWPFTALTAYMFGWGLLNALDAFVRACFGTAAGAVGWIPYAGRILSTGLHGIEHKISSILGRWIGYFEVQAGIRWHSLGQVVSQLAVDVEAAALMDWTIVQKLSHFLVAAQVHLLLKGLHAVGKVLVQRTTIVEQKVIRVEKVTGHAIGAQVVPKLGRLEGEYEHLIGRTIPNLHAAERATADSLARLWHRIRAGEKVVVTTAFAGAVAVALGRLGLGNLRCNSFKNVLRGVGCGGFKLLEDLLALAIEVLLVADICQITKLMISAAESSIVQDALRGIVDGTEALMLCQGVEAPVALGGYWTPPPPSQTFSALPA